MSCSEYHKNFSKLAFLLQTLSPTKYAFILLFVCFPTLPEYNIASAASPSRPALLVYWAYCSKYSGTTQ